MDIQLYKQNEISEQGQLVMAIDSQLANVVDDEFLKAKLILIIGRAFLAAGVKFDGSAKDIENMVNEIIREMRLNKTNIRIDEIDLAFSNGVHKKYGEYYGLNAVSFCQFIKSYVIDSNRLEAIRIKNTAMEEIKLHTPDELYQLSKLNAHNALNEFVKNGTVGRFGVIVYDFLTSLGIMTLDQAEKNVFWAEAKKEYLNYLNNEKFKAQNTDERKRIELDIKLFTEGGKKDRLITISKRLIVDNFYQAVIFDEVDLMAMIDEHKI